MNDPKRPREPNPDSVCMPIAGNFAMTKTPSVTRWSDPTGVARSRSLFGNQYQLTEGAAQFRPAVES
jgi:hypothetical protein